MFSSLKSLFLFNFILIILSRHQTYFDYCLPNGRNCYQVLGVSTNAPFSEIKLIYNALLQQYDYNVIPGKYAGARFVELVDCYEILRDERSRAQYNNDCLQSHYIPNSNNDSLWSLAIPIISIIVNQIWARNGQARRAGITWKKILEGLPYFIIAIVVVFYGIFGGEIIYFILAGVSGFALAKKAREKIRLFLRKHSIKGEIKNFFTDLRNVVDTNEERIAQETNDKRKAKEDGINLAKNQELEILKRYHNDTVGFVGGKPKNNDDEEEESKTLLRYEKEAEFEKIYNQNIQLCESRHSERLKEADEEFNGLTEKHAKAFESYRDFISRFEQDVKLKRKEKKTSNEELKEELQAMKKELEAKMSAGELIENEIEEISDDDSFSSDLIFIKDS